MTVRFGPVPEIAGVGRFDASALEAVAERVLTRLGEGESELSVSFVDDAAMAELNERYRARSGPTDVLSFSLREGAHAEHGGALLGDVPALLGDVPALLGDVVVDLEVAQRQARDYGHSLQEELLRLLVHGVLHLLGYDHEEEEEARLMEALEERLVGELRP